MRTEQYFIEKSPSSPSSEAYRILRTKLLHHGLQPQLKTILVTSAVRREGKSTVAKNLALALAQTEKTVVLVDGDLRVSNLTKECLFPEKKGLSDMLGSHDIGYKEGVLRLMNHLDFIPAGSPTPNPVERLASPRMKKLLEELRLTYDYVVCDAPSVLGVADAQLLAAMMDGVVLVVCPEKASLETVCSAKKLLQEVNATLVGAVLNQIRNIPNAYPQSG